MDGDEIGRSVSASDPIAIHWVINSTQAGIYHGRLWVYCGPDRIPVLARELMVEVREPDIGVIWTLRVLLPIGLAVAGFGLKTVIKSRHSYSIG